MELNEEFDQELDERNARELARFATGHWRARPAQGPARASNFIDAVIADA